MAAYIKTLFLVNDNFLSKERQTEAIRSLKYLFVYSSINSSIYPYIHSKNQPLPLLPFVITHTITHSVTDSLSQELIHSITHSLKNSLTQELTHSRTHLLNNSLTQDLTHSITHSLNNSLTQ